MKQRKTESHGILRRLWVLTPDFLASEYQSLNLTSAAGLIKPVMGYMEASI